MSVLGDGGDIAEIVVCQVKRVVSVCDMAYTLCIIIDVCH